jgi:hypothetical protein
MHDKTPQEHAAGGPGDETAPLAWQVCHRRAQVPAVFRVRVSPSVPQELSTICCGGHSQEPLGLPKFLCASLPACHGLRTPADLPLLAFTGEHVWPSGALQPSASATSALSKLYQHFRGRGHPCGLQDSLSTLRPSCSPCLHGSAMDARLDTGGWLALTRPGLSPGKRRQAFLGATTLALSRCWKQSGYSRRGNRSPRLCFKTVLAGFLAHGSSVRCPLSRAPFRACGLSFHAFPFLGIHISRFLVDSRHIQRYRDLPPAPHRPHVSISTGFPSGLGFLGNPITVPYPVDTCSLLSTTRGYSVPPLRMALHEGPHASPGFSGVSLGRLQNRPAPSLAFWPQPIIRVGCSNLTTIRTWIRLPAHMQLCSAGFPIGFRVTAFSPRFAD